jgi:antitoxin YefM
MAQGGVYVNPTLEALKEQIRRKGIRPITSVHELAGDIFESDDDLDEFLAELDRWRHPSGTIFGTIREDAMSITASEARKELFPLIKQVNDDHDVVEIVSKHGNAVLMSAEDYAALREGAYLLRSPANARRLLKAYENALNDMRLTERELIDPE